MALRVGNLSLAFRRELAKLGPAGSPPRLAVGAAVAALMTAANLPGPADAQISFAPGVAYSRRVPGRNLWIVYRFDATKLDALALRDSPPVPRNDMGGAS